MYFTGCYNLISNRDEVRIYPRETRLDTTYATIEVVDAQVLLVNRLENRSVKKILSSVKILLWASGTVLNPTLI